MPSGLQRPNDFRWTAASRLHLRWVAVCGAVSGALIAGDYPAHAQPLAPSASAKPEAVALPAESLVAEGRSVFPERARPAASEVPREACSFVAPVCVHAAATVADASMAQVLLAAERFYRVVAALGLPTPMPDGRLGGDARYDIYLVPDAVPQTVADGVQPGNVWDQSSAFTVLPPPLPPFACDADARVARSLARAAVFRIDAGVEDATMGIAESYVADIVTDCSITSIAAVDDLQSFPERSLGFRVADEASGAFLFARYLDDTYGSGTPGDVFFSLLSVAAQHTHPSLLHYANEPDAFDALRSNTRAQGKPIDDLFLEFAINRAFVGSRSDNGHLADVDKYGAVGRVRFEWSIPLATLPRRLAPMRPIEALGVTYLWLDLQGAPDNLDVSFIADWEAGVLFHWSIVKVDARGIEMGRIAVAGIRGTTHAERALVGLRGAAGLVIVGVNVGSIDRGHPFDPDEHEMARSYSVTLIK